MKVNIDTLRDTFKFGYEAFEHSRREADIVMDLYHNRQYTQEQIKILQERGQPKETFNIIKTFARLLLGYYSTIVNTILVLPAKQKDVATAGILNDLVDYIFRTNNFVAEGEKIKLDLILSGIMCSFVSVDELAETDEYNRPKYRITMNHVPVSEIIMDPMSKLDDYSDARFIHRFKWCTEESMVKAFGKGVTKKLEPYLNTLHQDDTEFTKFYLDKLVGYTNIYNNYLLVHSIMTDDNGDTWECYWSGETLLSKEKITFREVKSPYRVHKLHTNNNVAEYYGIFRDVIESQHAINQAIVKIQTMVNTQKVFYEKGAVKDAHKFLNQINRVNAIIEVEDLQGIKVENMTQGIIDQYQIIDRALDRIQRILSINDSFLGMAYASDSGQKVKLQQNASMVALKYLTTCLEQFYRLLGKDIIGLVKQYYTAHDVIRIADEFNAQSWLEINQPMMIPTGFNNPDGSPQMMPVYEEYRDPASGEIKAGPNGEIILAPIPTRETEIEFTEADVKVDSIAYNDEDERVRMILEQFISGPMGQMLSQANPAGYFMAGAIAMRETKSKYSNALASILDQTAAMLGGQMTPNGNTAEQNLMLGQSAGQEVPKSTANTATGM